MMAIGRRAATAYLGRLLLTVATGAAALALPRTTFAQGVGCCGGTECGSSPNPCPYGTSCGSSAYTCSGGGQTCNCTRYYSPAEAPKGCEYGYYVCCVVANGCG